MEFVDIALYIAYALVILALIGAIAFPLINSFSDPKSLLKSGVGLGVLAVVFLVSWGISGNEVTAVYSEFNVDAGLSKFIGGLLTMMYILTGLALVGIVYTEISKAIK